VLNGRVTIVTEGHPALRRVARAVRPDEIGGPALDELVGQLWHELELKPGVGLAAAQIGDDRAVAVVEDKASFHAPIPPDLLRERERVVVEPYVLVNPALESDGDDTTFFFEGCLSVDDRAGVVERARAVNVTWTDLDGTRHERRVEGWHARILQHEVDHLNGVLFVDRAHPEGIIPMAEYGEWAKRSALEIRRLIGL
jgi:peptide deformylase